MLDVCHIQKYTLSREFMCFISHITVFLCSIVLHNETTRMTSNHQRINAKSLMKPSAYCPLAFFTFSIIAKFLGFVEMMDYLHRNL